MIIGRTDDVRISFVLWMALGVSTIERHGEQAHRNTQDNHMSSYTRRSRPECEREGTGASFQQTTARSALAYAFTPAINNEATTSKHVKRFHVYDILSIVSCRHRSVSRLR